MNIGDKILELRKKKGITQEQLGDLLGVARQTISKWELNETSPNLEQTKNLAKILEVNIEEITSGDNLKKEEKQNDFFKIVINVLKIIFLIVIIVVIVLISYIYFKDYFLVQPKSTGMEIKCTYDNTEYYYEAWVNSKEENKITNFYTNDKNLNINTSKYRGIEELLDYVRNYVKEKGGYCGITHEG